MTDNQIYWLVGKWLRMTADAAAFSAGNNVEEMNFTELQAQICHDEAMGDKCGEFVAKGMALKVKQILEVGGTFDHATMKQTARGLEHDYNNKVMSRIALNTLPKDDPQISLTIAEMPRFVKQLKWVNVSDGQMRRSVEYFLNATIHWEDLEKVRFFTEEQRRQFEEDLKKKYDAFRENAMEHREAGAPDTLGKDVLRSCEAVDNVKVGGYEPPRDLTPGTYHIMANDEQSGVGWALDFDMRS